MMEALGPERHRELADEGHRTATDAQIEALHREDD